MLIIYAHPDKKGHNGFILEKIEQLLKNKKNDYKLLDLYEEDFDPILQSNELYTRPESKISAQVKSWQKLIKENKKIIVIFPNWWNSSPAILKGFFDKVLTKDFAFHYIGKRPVGLLKGKAAVIVTTGGPAIYEKVIAKNRALKTVTKNTLGFCGLKTKGYMIDNCFEFNQKQKNKINKKVNQVFKFFN